MYPVYPMLYKPTLKNSKKSNVINYKLETHALAYTCKARSFKCASAYIHAYNL